MAEESAKLRIPYIASAQAQKHVTHNEGVTLLDTLVQLSVLDKDLTAPPGSPTEGDTYIVASPATGTWLGWEQRVARFIDGEWFSYLPGSGGGAGWLAWVLDEDAMYRFDGTDWAAAGIEGPQGATGPDGADGADGPTGPTGPAGASSLTICRVKTTADVDLAGGALANGTTHDGVTVNTGDRVSVTEQTAPEENGIYPVPASGAASRDAAFDTYDEHPGVYFSVMEGTVHADTLWRCTSDRGGTLDTTALDFAEFTAGGGGGAPAVGGNVLATHEGLIVKYISATSVDIDAAAVLLKNSGGEGYRAESVNLTVDITASGANGLDTGSEASSTWYHVWVIYNGSMTAGLLSLSATSPTLPNGYTHKGYVGAVYNDSSSDFAKFLQRGNAVGTPITGVLNNGSASTYTAVDCSAAIPPTATQIVLGAALRTSSGTATVTVRLSSDGTGTTAATDERQFSASVSTVSLQAGSTDLVLSTPQSFDYYVIGTNGQSSMNSYGWKF